VLLAAAIHAAAFSDGPLRRADADALGDARVHPGEALHALATAAVAPFHVLPYAVLVLAVVAAAVLAGRPHAGVAAAAVMLGASVTTQLLKHVLAEPRPLPADQWLPPDAWPSGHTTAATAFAIALVLVTPAGHRRPVAMAGGLLVAAVGVALVVLGSHFPSDVLGGVCVAAAWGAAAVSWLGRDPSDAGGRPSPSAARRRGRARRDAS